MDGDPRRAAEEDSDVVVGTEERKKGVIMDEDNRSALEQEAQVGTGRGFSMRLEWLLHRTFATSVCTDPL